LKLSAGATPAGGAAGGAADASDAGGVAVGGLAAVPVAPVAGAAADAASAAPAAQAQASNAPRAMIDTTRYLGFIMTYRLLAQQFADVIKISALVAALETDIGIPHDTRAVHQDRHGHLLQQVISTDIGAGVEHDGV
jgi:hypothetical protein